MKISLTIAGSALAISRVVAFIQSENLDVEDGEAVIHNDTTPVAAAPTLPTAAPVAAAPTLPTAAPISDERDVNGLPWDERIHASTKTTKADGSWTKRRGVDDATYNMVEAELRAKVGMESGNVTLPLAATAPVPVAAPVAPVATVPTATAAAPVVSEPPVAIPMAAPVMAAPVPVAPVATPAGPPTNLNELMIALGPLTDPAQGGSLTPEYLQSVIAETSNAWAPHTGGKTLTSLADIAAFPNLQITGYIWQLFQRDGKVA